MVRQSKGITAEERVLYLGAIGLWLFVAILLVVSAAAALETIATR